MKNILPHSRDRTGAYTTRIKVFIQNILDWLEVDLRKTDVDYISQPLFRPKRICAHLAEVRETVFLSSSFK